MNNFEHKGPSSSELRNNYTPLTIDYESGIGDASTASFEAQILQKMQDKIMNLNTSMDSDATLVDTSNSSDNLKQFEENDEVESNESLGEAGGVKLTEEQVEILCNDNEISAKKDYTSNPSKTTINIRNFEENQEIESSDSFEDAIFTKYKGVVSKGCTILTTVVDTTSHSSGMSFNLKQFDENDEIMSIKIFDDQDEASGYDINISMTDIGNLSDNLNQFDENNKSESNKSVGDQDEAAGGNIEILTIDIGNSPDNSKNFYGNDESTCKRSFEDQTEAESNDIEIITTDTGTSYHNLKQPEENDELNSNQTCSKDEGLLIEQMGELKPREDQEILNEHGKNCNTKSLDGITAIPMKENSELFVFLMKNLPFCDIDDEMLTRLCERRLLDDVTYHPYFLENKYHNIKDVNFDNDNPIEIVINEVLEDIEGSINSLPVTSRNVHVKGNPLNEGNRLSRISEATNEEPESELLETTYEVTCSSDVRNDTFIVDDVEDIKECGNYTFTIDEVGDEEKEFDENKNIIPSDINQGNVEAAYEETFSEDEGIGDIALDQTEKSPVKQIRFDEHIKTLADAIYDYLQEQCFEIRELVLFPEILHDRNLNKLLAKLKGMYDEFYSNKLGDEEKNELRMSISAAILSNLENDSKVNAESSNDSSLLNIVSDKVFTITEFVSDILDSFFNLVSQSTCLVLKEDSNGENFLEFTKPFRDDNGNLLHSTPESGEIMESSNDVEKDPVNSPTDAVVTAFKKDTSRKSGAETFWISCNASPQIRKGTPKTPKRVFNIDDIPLRPPEDLVFRSPENNLCSIPEEARCNLFGPSYDEECELGPRAPETHETVEVKLDDILAGGDGSYISLDEPEMNVVVHNEVKFYRICTTNKSSFLKANSVTFQKNKINSENDSNESFYSACGNLKDKEDDDGDWMGYDMAKF
ncbi:hypothetical protein WA026_005792 [Henosepilachna vigintioctopunctata]|uniref:Uncharacterized protein n=1 Tax=Henosepilachna vigintioctopunctata TaxID=420089 RepID=A0AAW1TTS4_9CUCU